jgi:hypothetical protein
MALDPQWAVSIGAYFLARPHLVTCPFCPGEIGPKLMKIGGPVEMPGLAGNPTVYVVPLVCSQCAFVRLFSIDAIVAASSSPPP